MSAKSGKWKRALIKIWRSVDGAVKFPHIQSGSVGLQIGFDLSSSNLTTDILTMSQRAGNKGKILGIDPDPTNHDSLNNILRNGKYPISLLQKGTYDRQGHSKLQLTEVASFNVVEGIKVDRPVSNTIEIELDTVDNIIQAEGISPSDISHINITNNGCEYATLKGMRRLLSTAEELCITVIAGRSGPIGTIDDQPDQKIITELLESYGFKTRFYRMSHLLWWGVVHQLLIKRNWVFGKQPYGVVMAFKGTRPKWYQSYS